MICLWNICLTNYVWSSFMFCCI